MVVLHNYSKTEPYDLVVLNNRNCNGPPTLKSCLTMHENNAGRALTNQQDQFTIIKLCETLSTVNNVLVK